VQGVGFRYFAKKEADRRRLVGFARNLADGTVEIEVEGDPGSVRDYLATLRLGPRWGHVSGLNVEGLEPTCGDQRFEVRF
jgi:acylphosphatase